MRTFYILMTLIFALSIGAKNDNIELPNGNSLSEKDIKSITIDVFGLESIELKDHSILHKDQLINKSLDFLKLLKVNSKNIESKIGGDGSGGG